MKKMTEENDVRIERLEKASQEQQRQMAKMMEMLKTLIRDKAQATCQKNSAAHPDQRREDLIYPPGFTPSYAQA